MADRGHDSKGHGSAQPPQRHTSSRHDRQRAPVLDAAKISHDFQQLLADRRLDELTARRSRSSTPRYSSRTPHGHQQTAVLEPTHSTLHNIPKVPVPPNPNDTHAVRFRNKLSMLSVTPEKYENPGLLDEALSIIPLERIYQEAEEEHAVALAEATSKAEERGEGERGIKRRMKWGSGDYVIMALLKWYKTAFMTWVNNPPCTVCGSPTLAVGTTRPNQDDLARGAHRVELFQCSLTECRAFERFPRYGDVWAVMRSRRGRGGEWADCFTMLCRAVGSKVRWVWNAEDHVWTEVYSEYARRWVHVDSCEGAWDQPRMYAEGWGKKMSYCIAFSADGATDVTRRYVRDHARYGKARQECPEEVLLWILAELRRKKRDGLDKNEQARLLREDAREERELRGYIIHPLIAELSKLDISRIAPPPPRNPPNPPNPVSRPQAAESGEAKVEERRTGVEEWLRARQSQQNNRQEDRNQGPPDAR